MNWQEGRRLASATNGTASVAYTYDSEGLRLTKATGDLVYHYYYAGGKLVRIHLYKGSTFWKIFDFFYDQNGHPYALNHKVGGVYTTYYYLTNLQGDVLGMVKADGTTVAAYTYDPYGKPLAATGTFAATNPLRYRGYVYDPETGLYYLQSRYYDPQMGRFISPDALVSTGQGILGNNMFAYCLNNPVNMYDASGNLPEWIRDKLRWIEDNVISPIEDFVADVAEDIYNYDESNSDTNKVYKSHYFSSYNGTLVLRHSNSFLTSWAAFGVIVLNHSNDQSSSRDMTLKHEYGHILQEKELGSFKYGLQVFIPSATYNLLARNNKLLHTYYYSMPWECDADIRGGVVRKRAYWAEAVSVMYFTLWEG